MEILTGTQRAVLSAAVARLIPSDGGPGAAETGAVRGVENALGHRYFQFFQPWMCRGLDLLESRALARTGAGFAACPPEEQDRILREVESGRCDERSFPASVFFEALFQLAVEGFLGHPRHGGNRDFLAWRGLGLGPDRPPGSCAGEAGR